MNKLLFFTTALLLVMMGWLANDAYSVQHAETPRLIERAKDFTAMFAELPEHPLPADRISEDQIKVYPDKVVLEIPNARWATFAPTHSMSPVFDAGANAIQIVPSAPEEIKVGDIVSYGWKDGSTIIHRVIQTGKDNQGWYAILKGDNVPYPDPEKVRFSQIKKITVAIVY